MKIIASSNTGGSWALNFVQVDGSAINLSPFTIEVDILSDHDGPAKTIGDGGLSILVSGVGNGLLTVTLPDGHGLPAGVYPVHTRYHNGDGNFLDLHKGTLKLSTPGGDSYFETEAQYDGEIEIVEVLAAQLAEIDGGIAPSTYEDLVDGGGA